MHTKVSKEDLLTKVCANRKQHAENFERAQEIYQQELIQAFEKSLEIAREGKEVDHHINVIKPEHFLEDYDKAIQMLEWSESSHIELGEEDFTNLVLDNWGWSRRFHANTISKFSISG
jgi:hypothetical protein